jgi:transposase
MKIHAGARTCSHCRALIVSCVTEAGQPQTVVARQFRVSIPTVAKWVKRYKSEGADGLRDRSSRPHRIPRQLMKAGKELHDAVMSVLHTPPIDCGINRTTWRVKDLRSTLITSGIVASQSNVRKVIRKAGYQWKKARVSLTSTDPEYRSKLDAIKSTLANLEPDEAFFSIDELGPVAVKMRGGLSLQASDAVRTVPQWQESRGAFIVTAALELSKNQITYFFSNAKNTGETIQLIELLRRSYSSYRNLYLSWDAAPWHSSKTLEERIAFLNEWAAHDRAPILKAVPLPTSAQFLNVIESVFSGQARAVLHNSDYPSLEDAKKAVARYIDERNAAFLREPRRAGRSIWKMERVPSAIDETNNCKDLRYT